MSRSLTVQAPSSIGNVGVGFDVLGCALEHVGDEITVTKREDQQIIIQSIDCTTTLPKEISQNAVTVPILHFLKHIDHQEGFDIEIKKIVPPGSGLGSSAASSVAGVFAVNELLGAPLSKKELLPFAQEGERIACDSPILDNITPAMLGGITLIHKEGEIDIIQLPYLEDLYVSIIYPPIEVKTSEAREILTDTIPLKVAIQQLGSIATFISGLYENNYALIKKGLVDHMVEPMRASLIPGFKDIQQAALTNGALGCSISGSGPSIFAMSEGQERGYKVLEEMQRAARKHYPIVHAFVSRVNKDGVKIIDQS